MALRVVGEADDPAVATDDGAGETRLFPPGILGLLLLEAFILVLLRLASPADVGPGGVPITATTGGLFLLLFAVHLVAVRRSGELAILSLTFIVMTPASELIVHHSLTSPAMLLLGMTVVGLLVSGEPLRITLPMVALVAFTLWAWASDVVAGAADAGGDIAGIGGLIGAVAPSEWQTGLLSGTVNLLLILGYGRSRWFPFGVVATLLLAMSVASIYALYDVNFGPALSAAEELRRADVAGLNANQLGILSAALIPIAFSGLSWASGRTRRAAIVVAGLLIAGVIVSGSRTALGLTVLAAVIMLPGLRALRPGIRVLLIAVTIGGVGFAVSHEITALQRLETVSEDETVQWRRISADTAWDAAVENPVIGIGPGRFPEYNRLFGLGRRLASHNWYLEVAVALGFVGLALSTIYFVGAVVAGLAVDRARADRRVAATVTGLLAGMFVLAVGGFTLDFMTNRAVYVVAAALYLFAQLNPRPDPPLIGDTA